MLKIYDVKTEHRKNPMGIENLHPRFSWKLESEENNIEQVNYRIIVESSSHPVWDSGIVESGDSLCVRYNGEMLESRQSYTWTVKVTAQNRQSERVTMVSEPACFEMGLLSRTEWKAKWIEVEETVELNEVQPVWYLRKEFSVKPGLVKARIYQTAHGLYEFWLNGEAGTEEKFKPGFTSYYKRLQYQVYDITALLKTGENVWSVNLADGWWRGITGGDIRNNFGDKVAFLGQIHLTYEDGSSEWIVTDENFKAAAGAWKESDMKMGDVYDAAWEPTGWKKSGFHDGGWKHVALAAGEHYGYENLTASWSVPVKEQEQLEGKVFRDQEGSLVIDFGQNIAGYVRMKLHHLAKGQHIVIEHGEDLKDGVFYTGNISHDTPIPGRKRFQQVDYYAGGEPEETYCPMFSVFGFQYIRITGYDGEIGPDDFTAAAVYSDCGDTGSFQCSHKLVNKLVQNAQWSQKSNFLDVPTDCPTRERSPWTGDSQIYAKTAAWFADVYMFFEKWMKEVSAEQCENGKVLNITPNCMMPHDPKRIEESRETMKQLQEQAEQTAGEDYNPMAAVMSQIYAEDGAYIIDGSAGWADTATITPWTMYQCYGDRTILENQYDCAKKWVDYMITNAKNSNPQRSTEAWYLAEAGDDGSYIWDTRYQWGEWLEPDIENVVMSGPEAFTKPDPEVPTAYLCYSARLVSKMADVLGKSQDADYYRDYSEHVKRMYNKYLIGTDGTIQEGRQAPHVRALAFDLCNEEKASLTAGKLNEMIQKNEYILNTGFLSTAMLLNVLADHGYPETAYRLLEQEECPGWLCDVKAGATTIPESWGGKVRHQDSLNHYSYGAVCDFLFSYCAGIRLDEEKPGYKHFILEPVPGGSLKYAAAQYESGYGKIVSEWKIENEVISYTFTVPCNTSATVKLPSEKSMEIGSGTYQFSRKLA